MKYFPMFLCVFCATFCLLLVSVWLCGIDPFQRGPGLCGAFLSSLWFSGFVARIFS